MKSDTQTININTDKDKLFDFISDPENMAKWAPALCSDVKKDGDSWQLTTKMGEVKLDYVSDKELGVVDFSLSPPLPMTINIYTRILPNNGSVDFILTHFQIPFTPESAFEKQKGKIHEGMAALKELVENRD